MLWTEGLLGRLMVTGPSSVDANRYGARRGCQITGKVGGSGEGKQDRCVTSEGAMVAEYKPRDVQLLAKIRNDIIRQPEAYREGEAYLRTQYSADRLHEADQQAQAASKQDHPTPLTKEDWPPARRICKALQDLLDTPYRWHDPKVAQATLILAVLLWDVPADSQCGIFNVFGPWHDATTGPSGAYKEGGLGRWVASDVLQLEGYFQRRAKGKRPRWVEGNFERWMDLVAKAWNALGRPEAASRRASPKSTGSSQAPVAPPTTPFDDVDPHRHLPLETRTTLWAACELVRARPGDFAEAVAWLDKDYSEAAIRERLLGESDRAYRSALRQLVHEGDRCNTFPRRKALRAGRPELPPERRLDLLQDFWSCPEINGVPKDFAKALIEHPEKVRDWVVQLTIQTARTRGLRVEDGKVVQRSYAEVGDKGLPDATTVEIYWRWLDDQCLERLRFLREERRTSDADCRDQAKDRAGRLRQAVADTMETGLPAGREERIQARRVVLLACLLAYQHALPDKLTGEFCTWQWESTGSLFAALVGETYVPGRETVLFNPAHRPDEPFGPGSVNLDVARFAALVRRAVSLCGVNGTARQPAPADPMERAMGHLSATMHDKEKMAASGNAPTSTQPAVTYTVATVLELAGVSATTLNEYAKRAGVKTPARGKRNHRYSANDVQSILQTIINNSSDSAMRQRCKDALERL